jgi:hypothetical protein
MTEVYDLGDPAKPVKIRDFGLAGQEPGSTGPVPTDLHGPISMPQVNRIYFGYGSSAGGILQIVDREKLLKGPKEPTPANLLYPQIGRMDLSPLTGAHTAFPMLRMPIAEFANDGQSVRDIVMIVNEATVNECKPQGRELVWFTDITIETHPQVISNFNVREASGNFCSRVGRFGAHSSNEDMSPVFYKKLTFITFFNAGVRAVDVRDPYQPKEVGYFIPAITETLHPGIKPAAMQGRDPDQQRGDRRSRLHLHRGSRQHRSARPGSDGRGEGDRWPAAALNCRMFFIGEPVSTSPEHAVLRARLPRSGSYHSGN